MQYCQFCRAYTLPKGDKCSVCGMKLTTRDELSDRALIVRPYLESAVEPIRVRTAKGKTIRIKDARGSQPFYTKVVDPRNGEPEYLIMDSGTLSGIIGEMKPLTNGIGRQDGKVNGHKVTVAFTTHDDLIASLNVKSKRKGKKKSSKRGRR